MKKILLFIMIIALGIGLQAQERTVNSSKTTMKTDVTYRLYNGVTADTLIITNQDTIDYVFNNYNRNAIEKISIGMQLDTLAGNDSISYSLIGYNNIDDDGLVVGSGTSIATGEFLVNELDEHIEISDYVSGVTDDTSFRHYVLRLIQNDNASYDGGASIDWIKFKLYLK